MTRPRGFYGVAIYHPRHEVNVGGLWRSAHVFGASFLATVGARYDRIQAPDTTKAQYSLPLHHYTDIDDLIRHLPDGCPLVGVELDPRATLLHDFQHPRNALYLLGAEDHGLPPAVADRCHYLVQIDSVEPWSLNVASAGTVLLYDRHRAMARAGAVA